MGQYTVRVGDELEDEIEDFMAESEANQSADLRKLIERGLEWESNQARIRDLRNQLQQANVKNTQIDELVEYHEEERSLQRIQNDRDRMRSEAGVFTRAKWWFTGMPSVESENDE